MTDQILKQRVLDELSWEPSVNACHIGVTARDGVIKLTGQVESYAEKWAVERSVGRVTGVRAVAEEIEVRQSPNPPDGDEDLAKRALQVLSWNVLVPRDKVRVKVEKGWVTLIGDVNWFFQKNDAESAVRNLHGVTGVSNHITLKPSAAASDVRAKITTALGRNAEIEAANITVDTDGAKVTLSGQVESLHERELSARTAWSAPGVTQVENLLTVA